MSDYFNVSGTDIYLGNRHVGSILPDLWATLHDEVKLMLDCACPDSIPADEHDEEVAELEAVITGLREEIAELKAATKRNARKGNEVTL